MTHKIRSIPKATILLEYAQKEIVSLLEELREKYKKIINFTVEGPYVTRLWTKGECFERTEPDGTYNAGRANARVYIMMGQNIRDEHFSPFKEKIKEPFSKLEKRLGINIVPIVICKRELDLHEKPVG